MPRLFIIRNAEADTRPVDDDENRELFDVWAPDLSDVRPADDCNWHFVVQHYGVLTRFLDWKERALHGL